MSVLMSPLLVAPGNYFILFYFLFLFIFYFFYFFFYLYLMAVPRNLCKGVYMVEEF